VRIPVAENNPWNRVLRRSDINATMDTPSPRDVLRNLIVASAALNINADRVESWKALLRGLPAYAVDEDGALAEWAWPALRNNQAHRHASHLYPLLYEVDPSSSATSGFCRLVGRQSNYGYGGAGSRVTGKWPSAWCGLAWPAAHLGMADLALEAVTLLATRYWRPSLVSTHDSLVCASGKEALSCRYLWWPSRADRRDARAILDRQDQRPSGSPG